MRTAKSNLAKCFLMALLIWITLITEGFSLSDRAIDQVFKNYLPKPLYLEKVRQENKRTFAKMLKKSPICNKVEATITAQIKPIDTILGDVVLHLIAAQGISISKSGVVMYLQPNIRALVEML